MTKAPFICLALLFLASCGLTKVNIEKAKAGKCLNKAYAVTPWEYFIDFYTAYMNSKWDNTWYTLYETTDLIYYGQKHPLNAKRLRYFKKVDKDTLKSCLPGYQSLNPDKFAQIIRDSILTKINNTPNTCAQSTGRLEDVYLLKDGDIYVKFTYTKTCDQTPPTTTQYRMTLSGKDLSILSNTVE